MIYWDMSTNERGFHLYLLQEELLKLSSANGLHVATIKETLLNANPVKPSFSVIALKGQKLLNTDQKLSDLMIWGAVRVFSERAKNLAMEFGCIDSDFLAFVLTINSGEKYFMFLPDRSFPIVDFDKTEFLTCIPVENNFPIHIHMKKLVVSAGVEVLPACFCVKNFGYEQVLGEVFVTNNFKNEWEKNGFTGANFRRLNYK